MKTKLLKGLDERGGEIAKEDYHKALNYRKLLTKVLNEEIDSLHASMRDEEGFNSPSWPYLQADRVAQVKAFKKVISFLE